MNTTVTRALALAAVAVTFIVVLVGVAVATASSATAAGKTWVACTSEDGGVKGARCVWDAKHNSNGEGKSFIRRDNGALRYVTHARAHRMLNR